MMNVCYKTVQNNENEKSKLNNILKMYQNVSKPNVLIHTPRVIDTKHEDANQSILLMIQRSSRF